MADELWPSEVLEVLRQIRDQGRAPRPPGDAWPMPTPDVPMAPATGPQPIDAAAGAVGVRVPVWTLATSSFPQPVWRWHNMLATTGQPIGAHDPFDVPAPGTLTIGGVLETGTQWQVSVDAGITYHALTAADVPSDVWTEATISVVDGDHVLVSLPIQTIIQEGRVLYRAT